MIQAILTIIFYVWLFGILALLWLSYRNSAKHHEAAVTSAQAAMIAAEAAKKLAEMLEKKADNGASHQPAIARNATTFDQSHGQK